MPKKVRGGFLPCSEFDTKKMHQNYFNDFQSPKNYHLFSYILQNARASVWMMPKIRDSDLSISSRMCLKKTLALSLEFLFVFWRGILNRKTLPQRKKHVCKYSMVDKFRSRTLSMVHGRKWISNLVPGKLN